MRTASPHAGSQASPAWVIAAAIAAEALFAGMLYGPLFLPADHFGIIDYDYFLAWQLGVNDALKSGQLLLWFHHLCGGVPGLADPQSQALSPFNLIGLAFDPVVQSKISVALHLIVCAAGLHLLTRRAGVPVQFAVAAFVIWSGNGFVAFRLLHGQETFYPLLYLPLLLALLWPHLAAAEKATSWRTDLKLGTAVVALTILEDGFQVLIYAWIFLGLASLVPLVLRRDSRALRMLAIWMAWAVAICSVRLLPMAELLAQYPRVTAEADFLTPGMIRDAFLNPRQLELYFGFQPVPPHNVWAAYGAYIGWAPLAMFVYGLARFRQLSPQALLPFLCAMLGCFLLMLGHFAGWSPWALLHGLPLMDMVRAPHRFASMVILGIAIFALFAQQDLLRRLGGGEGRAMLIALVAAGACAAGQVRALRPLLEAGFSMHQPAHERIDYRNEFRHRIADPARMYSAVAGNQGIYNCYRALELPNAVRPDTPLAMVEGSDIAVAATIAPNTILLNVSNTAPITVLINENYHRDWVVTLGRGGQVKRTPAGLMRLRVPAGEWPVLLRFKSRMFTVGAILSVIFLLVSWLVTERWYRIDAAARDH